MANNRTCVVCGAKYEYCITCKHSVDINKTRWKAVFHDENCRSIYHAVAAYVTHQISKEEARDLLDACDLSINMVDNIKSAVQEIEPFSMPVSKEESIQSTFDQGVTPVNEDETTDKPVIDELAETEKEENVVAPTQNRKPYDSKYHGKKNRKR